MIDERGQIPDTRYQIPDDSYVGRFRIDNEIPLVS